MRLLRSQLRTKSSLRVIDADVLPLIDVAQEQNKAATESDGRQRVGPRLVDKDAADSAGAPAATALPQKIKEQKDLEPYEQLFANIAYWKRIGEEYQNPLIVTGTCCSRRARRAGFVQRETEVYDGLGRRRVVPVRTYMERKGFILAAEVHLHRRPHRRDDAFGRFAQRGSALQREAEHAGAVVVLRADGPAGSDFLSTLSSQKIKGTRILLK